MNGTEDPEDTRDTPDDSYERLRTQALALRREGLSRRQIRDRLKVSNNDLLNRLVTGEPPPAWTRRPRAKDALRTRARELRRQGWTYDRIKAELGVSKSSISAWVRDLPRPEPRWSDTGRMERMAVGRARQRLEQDSERQRLTDEARSEIGSISDRELLLIGTALYWAEGNKSKPYARRECVSLINSDPDMIRLFVRWLELLEIDRSHWRCAVSIHATSDLAAATRFWSDVVGIPGERFCKPWLKTNVSSRMNRGPEHHGCLSIRLTSSARLYRRIEGWWCGIVWGARSADEANRT
ncbi:MULTISPECIES: hypothetical protein [unclassified Streptomyces]|uniref:hypothetical protein n=1 Tax=unclassified Streptomyces TaxID=2593676 RepID=UPI002DD7D96C|nr:hypothetical protein [Streptomyces sp. NBC_01795]WSA94258.1 hypothetical protein OIE63_23780 [Streptomyces sp. NBC_01795]WSS41903.1 hypothetical protein OG220_15870 [Streptomyces sp. NBC_01187]